MARGGYRKGAGRKREYQEPVQKILVGLPQSVLQKLDDFAQQRDLSRPKAIALLLEKNHEEGSVLASSTTVEAKPEAIPKPVLPKPKPKSSQKLLDELRALKESLK
ncbi:MAG: hypothetical protein HQM13_03985 [SAR324 cluster bacterium]|nr:hypothetical protein [SAR324 cluster bacterium]